jgi:acyl-[acyl-carrier-protein]-phospholipid O-acyltransferase/long-chain-fatty-acid--[acyl-carrier-protein] ligase
MLLLPKKKRSLINRLIEKRNAFIRSDTFSPKKALNFLNISQFLGVINDNVFKFLTVFLLIDLKGVEASSSILFWVGTVYVLPFLLFSSAAGVLADKFSKQKIIVALKAVEVLTTALAIFAFWLESAWACYALLFLLSLHSAAFGPPKYSIIPEIVSHEKISKANGLITSFTYLGAIVGTVLASFTTQITGRNFALCAGFCFLIAIVGFLSSLLIPYTKPNKTENKIKLFFLKDIYKTLEFCYKSPHLLTAVLAAAFFLFLGAFFQLNIIPYAIQSLGLSEVGGGYLFSTLAIGIALGAVLVGKLSKHHIELGFSCVAGLILFFLVFILAICPKNLTLNILLAILIGCFSGFFIVPIDAYIQKQSPDEKRGQIVATSNFMSFTGVLMAPFSIYLLSGTWGLTAAQGFFFVSLVVLLVSISIISKISSIFFHFVGQKILGHYYTIKLIDYPEETLKPKILVLETSSIKTPLLVSSVSEKLRLFVIKKRFQPFDLLLSCFSSLEIIYIDAMETLLEDHLHEKLKQGEDALIVLTDQLKTEDKEGLIGSLSSTALSVKLQRSPLFFSTHKKYIREVLISFSKN